MLDRVQQLRAEGLDRIMAAKTLEEIETVRVFLLGKKGKLTELLKELGKLSLDDRRSVGRAANELKELFLTEIEAANHALLAQGSDISWFDLSVPGVCMRAGGLHPITQIIYDLNDSFLSLGFEVYDGPEITSERYAFDNLNFRVDHPARESMDTYWLKDSRERTGTERLCLRPHLTGGSVLYMQNNQPPFRFVYPGRVFRNEVTDARHERAFFQYEALIVDEVIPFSSGRLLIDTILNRVFGCRIETRMRAGYFPFVEPGFEIDMRCMVCGGGGCSVCKHVGWLEVMPGGTTHPNVLRAAGVDPTKWAGFYINIGLDRLVMMKSSLNDVRMVHGADLRFLQQY